tara:strand:+ start:988 stop:1206 length:219 start_codon:yes stop_codon:yes gene_type:complete
MANFEESLAPMKEMLKRHGIDLENCWNGNEMLICQASVNCLQCQKYAKCDADLLSDCPNKYLVNRLPRTAIH